MYAWYSSCRFSECGPWLRNSRIDRSGCTSNPKTSAAVSNNSGFACGGFCPNAIKAWRNSVRTLVIDFASTARSSSWLTGLSSKWWRKRSSVVRSSCSTSTRCRFMGTSIAVTTSWPNSVLWERCISSSSMAKTSADSRSSSSVMIIGGRSFSSRLHQCRTAEIAANEAACKCCNTTSTFTSENCSWKSSRAAEPYSTIDTRFSPHACCNRVTSSCSLLSGFFIDRHSGRGSPTATRATTAAHAATKPAAPATSTATQGVPQQKPGKSGPSASTRSWTATASRRVRNNSDDDKNDPDDQQRDPPQRSSRRAWLGGRHAIQLHTLVRRYQLGHTRCTQERSSAVVSAAQIGHHLPPNV